MGIVISVLFIVICVLLILVVLLQKGRGGGLGAALGGAGSAAFGTKVGDMMTWVTIVLTAMFLLLAIGGALWFRPPETQAETPSLLPNPATPITGDIRVTIEEAAEGDKIYYTDDGTEPSRTNGELYSNAIPVSPGTTVKAIAYPQRGLGSDIAVASYRAPRPVNPILNPAPNSQDPITAATDVTVVAGGKSDKVYYTIDGSEPTEGSRLYSAPISVTPKMTLKVRAFAKFAEPSDIVDATYGLKGSVLPTPATQPDVIPATQPDVIPATTTAPALVPAGQ
jgi:protein translocase SecG subunit